MLFELVQSIPTVLGWRFNLERIRRRNVVAGASALSMVIVVFITDLVEGIGHFNIVQHFIRLVNGINVGMLQ